MWSHCLPFAGKSRSGSNMNENITFYSLRMVGFLFKITDLVLSGYTIIQRPNQFNCLFEALPANGGPCKGRIKLQDSLHPTTLKMIILEKFLKQFVIMRYFKLDNSQ